MPLVALMLYSVDTASADNNAILLSSHFNLSNFNFLLRSTIKEHIVFHTRLICARTSPGHRRTIEFEEDLGTCHCFVHACGLGGAVVGDPTYPARIAYVLLNRAMSSFVEQYPVDTWPRVDQALHFPQGDALLSKFQNPKEADDLSRIEEELKEVNDIMVSTIDKLLKRGEDIDVLMKRTSDLSAASEKFYRKAKAQNKCCKWY